MGHVARKLSSIDHPASEPWSERGAIQEHGVVLRLSGRSIVVRTPLGEFEARRALSCLVEPMVGDYVLVSTASRNDAYVLAVLEREAGQPTTLEVDGDLRIAPRGSVTISSKEGIDLESAAKVSVTSTELEVSSTRGSFVMDQLSLLGSKVSARVAQVRVVGDAIDSVFQRVSQTVKRSFRVVEETDHLDAQDVVWNAKETMSIHAKNAIVTSVELVKLDGDQIHLG